MFAAIMAVIYLLNECCLILTLHNSQIKPLEPPCKTHLNKATIELCIVHFIALYNGFVSSVTMLARPLPLDLVQHEKPRRCGQRPPPPQRTIY